MAGKRAAFTSLVILLMIKFQMGRCPQMIPTMSLWLLLKMVMLSQSLYLLRLLKTPMLLLKSKSLVLMKMRMTAKMVMMILKMIRNQVKKKSCLRLPRKELLNHQKTLLVLRKLNLNRKLLSLRRQLEKASLTGKRRVKLVGANEVVA